MAEERFLIYYGGLEKRQSHSREWEEGLKRKYHRLKKKKAATVPQTQFFSYEHTTQALHTWHHSPAHSEQASQAHRFRCSQQGHGCHTRAVRQTSRAKLQPQTSRSVLETTASGRRISRVKRNTSESGKRLHVSLNTSIIELSSWPWVKVMTETMTDRKQGLFWERVAVADVVWIRDTGRGSVGKVHLLHELFQSSVHKL